MPPPSLLAAVTRELSCSIARASAIPGGSISDAFRVETPKGSFFLKCGSAAQSTFAAEAESLDELARANAVRVPRVVAYGLADEQAYLLLEWIEFAADRTAADAALGEQLAQLHRARSTHYGWHRDNTIGSTPQPNTQSEDWVEFWRSQRLGYQLNLARMQGAPRQLIDRGVRLNELLPALFATHRTVPSLIHGDLWSGNRAVDTAGRPVIFDPAVYYADREAELAMVYLFGGFDGEFFRAYESTWPLPAGAATRRLLYQLYHVLNHFNLFGGAYLQQSGQLIDRLLAQLRA